MYSAPCIRGTFYAWQLLHESLMGNARSNASEHVAQASPPHAIYVIALDISSRTILDCAHAVKPGNARHKFAEYPPKCKVTFAMFYSPLARSMPLQYRWSSSRE